MATAGSRWGVVMSRNSGFSDQVEFSSQCLAVFQNFFFLFIYSNGKSLLQKFFNVCGPVVIRVLLDAPQFMTLYIFHNEWSSILLFVSRLHENRWTHQVHWYCLLLHYFLMFLSYIVGTDINWEQKVEKQCTLKMKFPAYPWTCSRTDGHLFCENIQNTNGDFTSVFCKPETPFTRFH